MDVRTIQEKLISTEDDFDAIDDFCHSIIGFLAVDVERSDPSLGSAIHRIVTEIKNRAEAIAAARDEVVKMIKPCPNVRTKDAQASNQPGTAGAPAPAEHHDLRPLWRMAESMWEPIRAIERSAAALTLISLSPDVDGTAAGLSIFQLARTIDENLDVVDEKQREMVDATNSWNRAVPNDADGNGEVDEAVGEVSDWSELARLIEASKSAWAALHDASDAEEAERDEPSAAWNAATEHEDETLLAVCSYRCQTLDEVRMRAEYLATMPDLKHRMLPEFVEALLRSSTEPATA